MKKEITWHDDWIIPSAESPASLDFWDFHYKKSTRLTSNELGLCTHVMAVFFCCCFLCKTQRDAICRNQEPTDKTWDRYSTFYGGIFGNENSFKCIWFICYSFKQFNGVASWRGKKKVCVWIWFRMKISNITWILNESSNAKK